MKGGSSEELIRKFMRFLTVKVKRLESSRVDKGISNSLVFLTPQPGQVRVIRNFYLRFLVSRSWRFWVRAAAFAHGSPEKALELHVHCAKVNAVASRRYCTG
jgi:hypothetical protein